ncbi:DUF5672 family protein [Roseateles sp. BYS180W]|uniref:DUF5672 family protein n=1 Tax=Roseateles rivi TaxID=3299028 RepID=A0ABW7FY96_9BURK
MPNKRSLSLFIADTDLHVLANQAVRQCLASMHFDEVLIFSDLPEAFEGLPVIPTPKIRSIEAYNDIAVRGLAQHLRTDFVLTVQYDGFILDSKEFSPHFYHYDYIGAPWPGQDEHNDVGNGGFSWRSRRLVQAAAALTPPGPIDVEDLLICQRLRPELEAQGMRFAPRAVASHFSVEFPAVPYPTFGFHGLFWLPQVYRNAPDFLVDHLSDRIIQSRSGFLLPALEQLAPASAERLKARVQRLAA